ncbi:MAG: hypothetical protein H7318_04645 [Oligoflexus sp.]|nr:hypothetical protein [Oligoflexus sp.]
MLDEDGVWISRAQYQRVERITRELFAIIEELPWLCDLKREAWEMLNDEEVGLS